MPFINTSELNMHYESAGTGKEVLLLLHGNFATWRWWLPILKNPPRGYRVIAPDMRGCGDTDRPEDGYTIAQHAADLNQFIQTLNLRRFHLVGHSLGGCVSLEFALKNPKRTQTLTLVAPAPAEGISVIERANYGSSRVDSADAMYRAFRMADRCGTTRRMFQKALSKMMCPDLIECDFDQLVDDAVRMSRDAAVGHVHSLVAWDVQGSLKGLHLPVLIIVGKNDSLISYENLQKVAEKLPNGRLIVWPGMGHTPQLEQPQRFVNILNKFTKKRTTRSVSDLFFKKRSTITNLSDARSYNYHLMYD